jgi:Ca-activated chloride channel family protein
MRFLRPDLANWWLAVPLLIAAWALYRRSREVFRRNMAVAPRFAGLSKRSSGSREIAVLVTTVVTAGALVFALVRPQALLAHRVPEYERQDLVVLLDRSASMRAHDIQPSRFSRATLEIRNFLRHKPDAIDRVALVGFADASVVLSYLTSDVESIFFYLDWIDGDPYPLFGTNIGAALTSAMEVIKKDNRPTRKLILIVSDGEDYGNELAKALTTVTSAGLRVNTIGIGGNDPVPIPLVDQEGRESFLRDEGGRVEMTKFSESTLRRIASVTGGRYVRSTTGSELQDAIADIVKGERKIQGWRTTAEYRDMYPASLAVAGIAGAALWLLL